MLISIPLSQTRARKAAKAAEAASSATMRPRCPFTERDYAAMKETPELGESGEILQGITRLSDGDTGEEFGLLYRGFTESGADVIWCHVCTARHKQGVKSLSESEDSNEEDGGAMAVGSK
jgi:hypothetical protein